LYARIRQRQRFTVAQWAVGPGEDLKNQSAYTGYSDNVVINPAFFQRLDTKVEILSRAGIVSAIAPLWLMDSQTETSAALTEEQTALLIRYAVARWGAYPDAWLLQPDARSKKKNPAAWKKIGHAVFNEK